MLFSSGGSAMIEIHPPSVSSYSIDCEDREISKSYDNNTDNEAKFVSKLILPSRSYIDIEDGKFVGPIVSQTGAFGGQLTYRAIGRLSSLQYIYSFPYTYCAGHPDTEASKVPLSVVLSSDPPSQDSGASQYVVGRIWGANSLVWPETGKWSGGVWTCENAGTASRIGVAAIYYRGRLCSDVGSMAELDGGTFVVYRSPGVLMVKGSGQGDDLGAIHADNAFDTGVRLGDIETDMNIFTSIEIGVEAEWSIISNIVRDHGKYVSVRDRDCCYLDITDSAPGRGSFDAPFFELQETDISKWKRTSYSGLPPNAVFGLGRGEQYSQMGSLNRPMVAELVDTGGSYLSPWGSLTELVDGRYERNRAEANLQIKTHIDFLRGGDWIRACLASGDAPVVQILKISDDNSGMAVLHVGSSTLEDNFFDQGYEAESVTRLYGYAEAEDTLIAREVGAVYIGGHTIPGEDNPDICDTDDYIFVSSPDETKIIQVSKSDFKFVTEIVNSYVTTRGIDTDETKLYMHRCDAPVDDLDPVTSHSDIGGGGVDDIAVNSNYIYVADYNSSQVRQYNKSDYSHVRTVSIEYPASIAADDGGVIIGSHTGDLKSLKKYTTDLSFVAEGDVMVPPPYTITIDASYIYTYEYGGLVGVSRIRKYNRSTLAPVAEIEPAFASSALGGSCGRNDSNYVYFTYHTASYTVIYVYNKSDLSSVDAIGESVLPSPYEFEFTTKNFNGSPTKVLFALECMESGSYDWGSIAGTFTLYVNGILAETFRDVIVAGTPIEDFDVSPWLNLDGSTETIEVYLEWIIPSEEITFKGSVVGIDGYI